MRIPLVSETTSRSINFRLEQATSDAEWEVYYNGTWRDVSDDFRYDVTKEGNVILRAIRYDNGGFRSYREDRGLILRRKQKEEAKREFFENINYNSLLGNFAASFGTTVAVNALFTAIPALRPVSAILNNSAVVFGVFELAKSFLKGNDPSQIALDAASTFGGAWLGGKLSSRVGRMVRTSRPVLGTKGFDPFRVDLIIQANKAAAATTRQSQTAANINKSNFITFTKDPGYQAGPFAQSIRQRYEGSFENIQRAQELSKEIPLVFQLTQKQGRDVRRNVRKFRSIFGQGN